MIPDHCYKSADIVSGDLWDDSVLCDSTVVLRGILFTNAIPKIDFNAIDIRVNLLTEPYEDVLTKT